eukprot:UN04191
MILLLIVLSTVVFLLASLPRYKEPHPESEELTWIEAVTCIIFTIEYIPKLLLCSFVSWECLEHCLDIERPETAGRCSKIRDQKFWYFLFDPLSLVDLMAILPFWVDLLMSQLENDNSLNLIFLRSIRLVRVVRIFKLVT